MRFLVPRATFTVSVVSTLAVFVQVGEALPEIMGLCDIAMLAFTCSSGGAAAPKQGAKRKKAGHAVAEPSSDVAVLVTAKRRRKKGD